MRDSVIFSTRVPRRRTTVVFDAPHPMPMASNTTTGLETASVTPCRSGPGQRCTAPQESPTQRSMRSESAAISTRARVPCMTAECRATATAAVTSWAAVFTANQSRKPARLGSVTPVTMARIASTTTSSARVRPRRMGRNKGRSGYATGIGTMRRKARKREICGLTETPRKRYLLSRPHVALRHGPCPRVDTPARQASHSEKHLGMPVSGLKFESLPHAIFLQRVSGPESATTLEARLGQGAFLALRLVDLLASDRAPVSTDAFHYQWVATDRFCRELHAAATEGAHVHGIAESASESYRLGDIQLISPALFAYAHFLEAELRLEEALDVLTTLLLVVGNRLSQKDQVAAQLRFARVHRKLNRFDEADAAYTEAGEVATLAGDRYSALLSRIGRANTMLGRGNLADAERRLEEVLADARAAGERDVEARAEQGIAAAFYYMGQPAEAIPHAWQAFQLYEEDDSKLRALGDMGTMFLSLGGASAGRGVPPRPHPGNGQ